MVEILAVLSVVVSFKFRRIDALSRISGPEGERCCLVVCAMINRVL